MDPNKLDQFKQAAISMGYDPNEVDGFTKMAAAAQSNNLKSQTNDIENYTNAVTNGLPWDNVPEKYKAVVFNKLQESGYQVPKDTSTSQMSPDDKINYEVKRQKALNDVNLDYETKKKAALDKITGSDNNGKLTPAQQLQRENMITAINNLDDAYEELVTKGGAQGATRGFFAGLPVIGGLFDPAGASYKKTQVETATQLAKAITGNSRVSSGILNQYLKSLPDISNTPKEAESTINNLRDRLRSQAKASGFNDIVDMLDAGSNNGSSSGPGKYKIEEVK